MNLSAGNFVSECPFMQVKGQEQQVQYSIMAAAADFKI
jgi:hypothetical protein